MKKGRKKLTNVSFDFTHTYTLKKLKIFLAQKNVKKKSGKGGGGAITAPCGQDTTPHGSKPVL